ncbi:hypothetical protein [Phaffia rhodozyma]|uniref:Protein CPL1-like domain-containing protein n=1 Tax=Phaffia rhodozyma TaxID=264483 RepID=A0A0F7SS57_PHARH|nr:hypothetical protein [Phaffia rhodozyma]
MLALNFFATFLAAASLVAGAITAPICVDLNVKVLIIDLGSTCICATANGLTPQSILNLQAGASKNSGLLGLIGQTVNSLVTLAQPIALGLLGSKTTSCKYPANSVPNDCSGTCGFTCATGYQRCSGQCVANGQTCISPGARRRNLNARSRNPCPGSMTACPVSTLSGASGFECIDTKANIESCGGCTSPFPGAQTGLDCTSIPHAGSVECQESKCVVLDCERGYALNHNATACVPKQSISLGRLITEGAPLVFSK